MQPAYLRRHSHRGTYDLESAKAVFDDCFIAHVSYIVDGLPACMPMIALVMEEQEESGLHDEDSESASRVNGHEQSHGDKSSPNFAVYLHGHPSTKLMELVRKSSKEREEGDQNAHDTNGLSSNQVKVCITATKVDGLVLSSAPNGHSFNFRSATIHGTCEPVRSKAMKRTVMRAVTNKIVANRWEEVNPVASYQVSLVYVVKVKIDSLSVKTRTGAPGIQPRNTELDGPDIETPPWAGVVPVWEQLGEPIDSGLTPKAVVSDNLREYISGRNEKQEAHAKHAAK